MNDLIDRLHNHRHAVLLVVLILVSVVQPLVHGVEGGFVVFDVILTLLLAAVFAIVFERRGERWFAMAVALPAITTRWTVYGSPEAEHPTAAVIHHGLIVVFFAFAVFIILRSVFRAKMIRVDHLLGTVCGYLLAAMAFANTYVLFDLLVPGSFKVSPEIAWQLETPHLREFLFAFFSLSTITSLGYNDVTPIRPAVESLTWLEAVFGQFYLAVVVAELIGLRLARAATERREPSDDA